MKVLGIETSCDESSVAIVDCNGLNLHVDSVETVSQVTIHATFGGVVPEVASRNHLEALPQVLEQALQSAHLSLADIDLITVTQEPGLVGGLLVGLSTAKTLAYLGKKPLIGAHHLEGHLVSPLLDLDPTLDREPLFPSLQLVVSGGHTHLYWVPTSPDQWSATPENRPVLLGRSLDDAAGEAFDKTAKLMGFSYPGGKWIDQFSDEGDPTRFNLPRALPERKNLNFSFSGLKTQVSLIVKELESKGQLETEIPNLCASIQAAIVDVMIRKIDCALEQFPQARSIWIVGGVAANRSFRTRLQSTFKLPTFSPQMSYCTDNAAMIAAAGYFEFLRKGPLSFDDMLKLNASARGELHL